jgi:hypothetical protein
MRITIVANATEEAETQGHLGLMAAVVLRK